MRNKLQECQGNMHLLTTCLHTELMHCHLRDGIQGPRHHTMSKLLSGSETLSEKPTVYKIVFQRQSERMRFEEKLVKDSRMLESSNNVWKSWREFTRNYPAS